jgi:PEP-CTERM motif
MIERSNSFRGAVSALVIIGGLTCGEARAAMGITFTNSPITENFDTFAGTIASIPANFTWTPDGVSGSATNFERGFLNPALQAYNNNNGLYALYYSLTDDQSDRAFGTKRQPNATPIILAWSFINQTGAPISGFNVSWAVEQYTQGGRPTKIDFDYDANGTGPTQGGISGTTLTTAQTGTPTTGSNLPGGTAPGGGPPIITLRSISISLATPLADGQPIDFRWITTGNDPSGGNAHFGLDNLSVTALAVPEPSSIQMIVLALSVVGGGRFLQRRPRRL